MKRMGVVFAMVIAVCSMLHADTEVVDGVEWHYEIENSQATIVRGTTPCSGDLVIPSKLGTCSVTSIGRDAFSGCTELISVIIPKGVANICGGASSYSGPGGAFCGCSGLKRVTIPSSVTNISVGAFLGCTGLGDGVIIVDRCVLCVNGDCPSDVKLPNGVRLIAGGAFEYCTGLKSVTIPQGVTSVGSYAFDGCHSLERVTIPDGVRSMGDWTFQGCTGLVSVTLPRTLKSIGNQVFAWCTGLKNVTLPSSVTSIGYGAFSGCSGLTSVAIPESVTNIGYSAFSGCCGLGSGVVICDGWVLCVNGDCPAEVTIPEGTKGIAVGAFSYCSGLASVTIPESVTSIGERAFSGCRGLTSVTMPESVTSIGYGAFSGCSGLTSVSIPERVTSIGGSAFSGCSGLTSVTMPESVTSIGHGAFSGCSGLTSVTMSESVTSIGGSSFSGCSGLTSVTIPESVTNIGDYAFSGCSGLVSVTLPNGVTNIGCGAFECCYNLTNVTMSSCLKAIGENAFFDCCCLTDVLIPDDVTNIGGSAFENCSCLTNVSMSSSLLCIGSRAFSGCGSLLSVTIPNGVTNIGCGAFECCYNLTNVTMSSCLKAISENAFFDCCCLTDVQIPGGVTNIGGSAFENCSCLTNVSMSSSLLCIGSRAFSGCGSLMSVTIPDGVTNINTEAFAYCQGLKDVVMPDGVMNISSRLFVGCSGLTNVTMSSAVTDIGWYAFEKCRALENMTLPCSITNIGVGAFCDCAFINMTIPNSVRCIGTSAFDGCYALTNIDFEGAPPKGLANAALAKDIVLRYNVVYADEWEKVIEDCGFTNAQPYVSEGLYEPIPEELRYELLRGVTTNITFDITVTKAKGLPAGLKFKDNAISGTPKKSGVFVATLTMTGNATRSCKFVVSSEGDAMVDAVCDATRGTVKGMGVCAANMKITLKATALKGYVFTGWHSVTNGCICARVTQCPSLVLDCTGKAKSSTSQFVLSYDGTQDETFYAAFESAADDLSSIAASVNGIVFDSQNNSAETNLTAGVYVMWSVAVDALSMPSVKVSGLPSGLKFTTKDIVDKNTKLVTVPANSIYGAPTTVSKKGKKSIVKISVTTQGKSKQAFVLNTTVSSLPDYVVGTFVGGVVQSDDTPLASSVNLTVSANGKISGKRQEDGKTYSLSASYFAQYDVASGFFYANVAEKKGKSYEVVVSTNGVLACEMYEAWWTNWKIEPWKTYGKQFGSKQKLEVSTENGSIILSFSANGTVKVNGTFSGYKASGSTILAPQADDTFLVFVYFPPKASKNFAGYSSVLTVRWDGISFAEIRTPVELTP